MCGNHDPKAVMEHPVRHLAQNLVPVAILLGVCFALLAIGQVLKPHRERAMKAKPALAAPDAPEILR